MKLFPFVKNSFLAQLSGTLGCKTAGSHTVKTFGSESVIYIMCLTLSEPLKVSNILRCLALLDVKHSGGGEVGIIWEQYFGTIKVPASTLEGSEEVQ